MEASIESCSHVFPGNCLYLAGINQTNPSLDLFGPSRLHILVRLAMKGLQ